MSISATTTVRVYCDGGTHQGLEFILRSFPPTKRELDERVRAAGWVVRRDYTYFCPIHK